MILPGFVCNMPILQRIFSLSKPISNLILLLENLQSWMACLPAPADKPSLGLAFDQECGVSPN